MFYARKSEEIYMCELNIKSLLDSRAVYWHVEVGTHSHDLETAWASVEYTSDSKAEILREACYKA